MPPSSALRWALLQDMKFKLQKLMIVRLLTEVFSLNTITNKDFQHLMLTKIAVIEAVALKTKAKEDGGMWIRRCQSI